MSKLSQADSRREFLRNVWYKIERYLRLLGKKRALQLWAGEVPRLSALCNRSEAIIHQVTSFLQVHIQYL